MKQIKKVWVAPKLTVHGDVEVLTQQQLPVGKKYGANDGFQNAQGATIGNIVS